MKGELDMAHKESIQSGELKEYLNGANFFWNVSNSVGYGCRNKKEDVLLVQFFINQTINGINTKDAWAKLKTPDLLEPDGDFGGKTWAATKWIQRQAQGCVVDGMVSAPDGTRFRTPKQKRIYTIYDMNAWYQFYYSSNFQDLCMDPALPTELTSHLYGPLPDLG